MNKSKRSTEKSSQQITEKYFRFLEKHIAEVVSQRVNEFMEINQIAKDLHVSHKHLTETIQKETGNHPCYFYDQRIIEEAKRMLVETNISVAEIERIMTYDPSNFSKFFKKFVGQTPSKYRDNSKLKNIWY